MGEMKMSEQTTPPVDPAAEKAKAEAEAAAKAKAEADAKAAAEKAAAEASVLPKLTGDDAFYEVEIPGCWSGRLIVVAASDEEAVDRYTAHHGIHSYDRPATVNKVEKPDVCDLPREPDSEA